MRSDVTQEDSTGGQQRVGTLEVLADENGHLGIATAVAGLTLEELVNNRARLRPVVEAATEALGGAA